jgi:hypothetical protein
MKYFGNYVEDAVIREDDNGKCWAKLWSPTYPNGGHLVSEYPLGDNSDMRNGTIEYDVLEITESDYLTFGRKWHFGETFQDRVTI